VVALLIRWIFLWIGSGSTLGALLALSNLLSQTHSFLRCNDWICCHNILPRVGEFVRPYIVGKREVISEARCSNCCCWAYSWFHEFYFIGVLFSFFTLIRWIVCESADAIRPFFLLGSIAALVIFYSSLFKAEALFRCSLNAPLYSWKAKRKSRKNIDKFLLDLQLQTTRQVWCDLFQSF